MLFRGIKKHNHILSFLFLYSEFSYSCISLALKSGHLPEVTCALDCIPLKPSNYLEILWTAAAEFPGILNNIIRDVL